MNRRSNIYRALVTNPGLRGLLRTSSACTRATSKCRPAAAVGTARAHRARLRRLRGRRTGAGAAAGDAGLAGRAGDSADARVLRRMHEGRRLQFSLGFMKSSPAWPFGSARSFGSPGAGGALGFADPAAGIGYAYVTSQMGTRIDRRPAGRGAQRRALLRFTDLSRVEKRLVSGRRSFRGKAYGRHDGAAFVKFRRPAPSSPGALFIRRAHGNARS